MAPPSSNPPAARPTAGAIAAAGLVHGFTAFGACLGLLAVCAIQAGNFYQAMVWLSCAYFIDIIDGTLARAAKVQEVLPNIDGRMLDYVIDFLNIVFIPAYFVYAAGLTPRPFGLGLAWLILLVSAYHYANKSALTDDFYFKGFPAMWSVVVFYLFIGGLSQFWNAVIIVLFSVLHFVPIKFIYPTRTLRQRKLTVALSIVWVAANALLLAAHPARPPLLLAISLGVLGYYAYMSVTAPRESSRAGSLASS